jgi:hypothetical protein
MYQLKLYSHVHNIDLQLNDMFVSTECKESLLGPLRQYKSCGVVVKRQASLCLGVPATLKILPLELNARHVLNIVSSGHFTR